MTLVFSVLTFLTLCAYYTARTVNFQVRFVSFSNFQHNAQITRSIYELLRKFCSLMR
nr:MAG TPA: hypothetical protein [Caudoviricetes sp.]